MTQDNFGPRWERRSAMPDRHAPMAQVPAPADTRAMLEDNAVRADIALGVADRGADIAFGSGVQWQARPHTDAIACIQIRTFGGLRVIASDGSPVCGLSARQLQLLRWLVLARWGSPLSVASVTDAMWPEAEGAAASSNFASTVRRLRAKLGDSTAIRVHAGMLSLAPSKCTVDLDELHCLHALSEPMNGAVASDEASRLADRWLVVFHDENPVLNAQPDTAEMASRIRSVGIAWRHATLRLCQLLRGTPHAEKALRLCEAIERHGFADARVMAEWHSLTLRGDPGRRRAERRSS